MSSPCLRRLFFYVEKLKIGGLRYDKMASPAGPVDFMDVLKEEPRERQTEYIQLEQIKNTMKLNVIKEQKIMDSMVVNFEELELIYIGNKNKNSLISTQLINYLFWLIYRHHAPRKAYNFLLVLILILMIVEKVGVLNCSATTVASCTFRHWRSASWQLRT